MQERKPQQKLERKSEPKRRKHRRKATVVEPDQPTVPLSRLAKELDKPDIRVRCPVHGPKGTTVLHKDGIATFICCGRMVE